MQEIQNGTTEKIELTIFNDGVLINADGNVLVQIYNADDISNTLTASGYAINETPIGSYTFQLTPSITSVDRVLRVVWSYSVNSESTSQTTFISVITPYALTSDIIDYYNLGTKPQDLNYKPIEQIVYAEKIARTLIDNYTGLNFGKRYSAQEMFGIGSDAIELTERMISIDKVYENDVLVLDNSASFNSFGYPINLTQTGKAARISNIGWDLRYDPNVDVTVRETGKFRDGSRYSFVGQIGYPYVPQDIKLCSILLAGDVLSGDANWRIKYLKEIDLGDVSFKLSAGAFNGTGNAIVDNILDSYRNVGIVVI